MIAPALVKAQVVDITRPQATFPRQVAVDANVLYFVHYPNFAELARAGGKTPATHQTNTYAAWITKALKAGTKLFASTFTLGEFLRLTEYAELESFWLTHPLTPSGSQFSPREGKQARYEYPTDMAAIRRRSMTFLAAVRKTVELFPKFKSEIVELDEVSGAWESSAGDFADAFLVASARLVGMRHLLTDDGDLLTFDGLTVYTANRSAIQAAANAGKLLK